MAAAMRQAGKEAAKKAGDAKAKALAQAGVNSKLPSETQRELVDPEAAKTGEAAANEAPLANESTITKPGEAASTTESNLAPGDEIYAGQGERDPDKEAVVPDSDDKVDVEKSAANDTVEDKTNDPDAEAVVPGSKVTVGADEIGLPDRGIASKDFSEVEDEVGTEPRARNTIEKTTAATAPSKEGEDLPGKRTQDQAPANAEEAGSSVAD